MALLILGIPFISLAKTCDVDKVFINSISVSNKSENVIEIENPQANKKQVDINLNMKEKNDFIEYKIEVKNESDEDFYFDKNLIIGHSKYIDYKLSSDDNSYIVKGNSSKKMTIKVYLKEDVAQADYTDGIYSEDNIFVINISNERIKNPLTGRNYYIMLLCIIMITVLFTFILWKNDKKKSVTFILLVLGTLVLSPICINALCKAEFKINSKVIISTKSLSSFNISCAGDEKFYFYEGMTFGDWIKSDLYQGNIGGDYDSIEQCIQIWGNNRGCTAIRYEDKYSILTDTYDFYTISQEECEEADTCEQINNQYYLLEYAYDEFNTLEECEDWYGEGECQSKNFKYYHFEKGIYLTQSECENEMSYYDSASCTLLPVAYHYIKNYYWNYDTSEECEEEYQKLMNEYLEDPDNLEEPNQCITRRIEHRNSPTPRNSNLNGKFDFGSDGFHFVSGNEITYFRLNDILANTTYACSRIGECVSPESNILSGSNTIKAKDIKVNDLVSYYDFKTNKVEIGKVGRVYIHEDATSFIKLTFEDNSYIEMTDYHPIYTSTGWKSYTNRNGYPKPKIGDLVKSNNGYKKLVGIKPYVGKEDFYDFEIISKDGKKVDNYFANGALVQGSYNN